MLRCLVLFLPVLFAQVSVAAIKQPAFSSYGFIENKGQIMDQHQQPNPAVLYLYSGNGLHVQLRKNAFSYEVIKTERNPRKDSLSFSSYPFSKFNNEASEEITLFIHRVDISFLGANPASFNEPYEPATDYINYYTTGTPEEGATFVHHYKKILYKNVYPLIDIEFLLEEGGRFKYNFIVHPGGKANQIKMKIEGASKTSLTKEGSIKIETAYGELEETIPESYTITEQNNKHAVEACFRSAGENLYSLSVKKYDPNQTLIIDPIAWITYFGGSEADVGRDLCSDKNGNIYLTGSTSSTTSIATSGAFQSSFGSRSDGYITKVSPAGNKILWATYFGGNNSDALNSICIDSSGNILVAGSTGSTINMATSGAHQVTFGGGDFDGLVAKFTGAGTRIWSTYYGGSGFLQSGGESMSKILIDTKGNIVVSGTTPSTNNIATGQAHQPAFAGGAYGDAFMVKFNSSGIRKWATYYGGSGNEFSASIAIDTSGNIFLYGNTASSSGIASSGAHKIAYSGASDAFLAKFDSTGSRKWGTYFGGNGFEDYGDITSDHSGNVIIAGTTLLSDSGIATPGAYRTTRQGYYDVFIAKFNTNGIQLWGTYYGGTQYDFLFDGVVTDRNGNIFIAGETNSTAGIASPDAYQTNWSGMDDIFLTKFSPDGLFSWGTYLGSRGNDLRPTVSMGADFAILITGFTTSDTGFVTSGAVKKTYGGGVDAFIIKIDSCRHIFSPSSNSPVCEGQPIQFLISKEGLAGGGAYFWSGPNSFVSTLQSPILSNASFGNQGVYQVIRFDSGTACFDTSTINVVIQQKPVAGFISDKTENCLSGNLFNLNDTSISGASSRIWYFEQGDSVTSSQVSKSFSSYGKKSITLVSIGSNGCTDTSEKTITVHPQTNIGYNINHDTQCIQNSFLFTDTSSIVSGSFSRTWQLGDGNTSSLAVVTKSYAVGSYAVTLKTVTNLGCIDSLQQNIRVLPFPKPEVGFTLNEPDQCFAGNSFVFTDTSSISSGSISRAWTFGDASNGTNNPFVKNYADTGTFLVRLMVTSDQNCMDSVKKWVTVHPQPRAGFSSNSVNQCLNENSFVLNDTSRTGAGILSTSWNLGDNTTSLNKNVVKNFTAAGNYTILLRVISDKNCSDSVARLFSVFPQTNVGFTVSGSNSQCQRGNIFTFTDTSSISNGTFSRLWLLGDGSNAGTVSVSKSYTNAGSYIVRLITTTDKGCMDTVQKNVLVYQQPVARFDINDSVQCFIEHDFVFTDNSFAGLSYNRLWNLGDGNLNTNNLVHKKYSDTGRYVVQLLITDDNNCRDSTGKNVQVKQNPQQPHIQSVNVMSITSTPAYRYEWFLDNIPVPNSNRQTIPVNVNGSYVVKVDSSNGCSNSSYPLNISFIHDGEIKIYPNPNRGDFIIDFNGLQGEKNIHVFNVLGQSVAQYSSSFNKIRINMDNRFAKGVYVLEILSSAGVLFKKVIVE